MAAGLTVELARQTIVCQRTAPQGELPRPEPLPV